MRTISDWVKLIQQGRHVVGLEMATIERWSVFEFFLNQAIEMNINCYYWNLGYAHWQQLIAGEQVRLNSTKLPSEPLNSQTVLPYFCQGIQRSGIYLIDDLIVYSDDKLSFFFIFFTYTLSIDKFSRNQFVDVMLRLMVKIW